jgi:hypothetical protein
MSCPQIWQEGGKEAETAATITPYGRGFCERKATYFVWPLGQHVIQNTFIHLLRVAVWTSWFIAVLYIGIDLIKVYDITGRLLHSGLAVTIIAPRYSRTLFG